MASLIETKVLSFGANGDGLVLIKDKPAYIPETVPGDTLRLRYDDSRHVELIDILAPSPIGSPSSVPFRELRWLRDADHLPSGPAGLEDRAGSACPDPFRVRDPAAFRCNAG